MFICLLSSVTSSISVYLPFSKYFDLIYIRVLYDPDYARAPMVGDSLALSALYAARLQKQISLGARTLKVRLQLMIEHLRLRLTLFIDRSSCFSVAIGQYSS